MQGSTGARLSGEERREHILRAVQGVFAEKGFDRTTTRELAEAAGVSEALLFKHFPNKEAIYRAILDLHIKSSACEWDNIASLPASTETLVYIVRYLVRRLIEKGDQEPQALVLDRMILRSLVEDGSYARVVFDRVGSVLIAKLNSCLKAAARSGDLQTTVPPKAGAWLVQHVPMMILILQLPPKPTVDYGLPTPKLIDEAIRFCLRGLGLHEEAIRHFNKPRKPTPLSS